MAAHFGFCRIHFCQIPFISLPRILNVVRSNGKGQAFGFSPQLCVGFLFLVLYPGCLLLLPPPPASSTHHLFTHNFVTHHLSHTIMSPSFTHNLVTHNFVTFALQAWHNLTSTFVLRGRRGTISHPPSFRVAGVALMALRGALRLA